MATFAKGVGCHHNVTRLSQNPPIKTASELLRSDQLPSSSTGFDL